MCKGVNDIESLKKIKKRKKHHHKMNVKLKRKTKSYIVTIMSLLFIMMLIPTIIVIIPRENQSLTEEIVKEQIVDTTESTIEIEVYRKEKEKTEKVPLEEYVASVVAAEMPAEFEMEALKAQAIVARTYVINYLTRKEESITDTTEHQVYKNKQELQKQWGENFSDYWKKINEAVQATEGIVITYKEEPITPTYFSMSNGYTEDPKFYWGKELPYLKSVESKWEEKLPNFIDQKIVTINEINKALQTNISQNSKIDITRTPSNRVLEIKIDGNVFSGRDVREKLQLRSNDFTIKQKDDYYIFTTKGYGHGVGMSQYGANEMAKEGKNYADILHHYYQEIDFTNMKESTNQFVIK